MSAANLCLFFFSEILLSSIALLNAKTKDHSLSHKLYLAMLYTVMFMLAADLMSRCDGLAYPIYPVFNRVGNFILFLFNPVCPILWFLYAHNQVHCDDSEVKRIGKFFSIWFMVNVLLLIVSQFTGWYYSIDSNNVYHRGPFFSFIVIADQILVLSTFILLIVNRKKIERTHYFAFLFYGIIPTICIILQAFFYGLSFALNGISLSLIIVYIYTQSRKMNVDYLTDVFNRKQLDYYIGRKIHHSSDKRSFSAILIDLDNFKMINDNFGHGVGDEALKITVQLLKECIRRNDFLARYGGDEFYIVMDIDKEDSLTKAADKINHHFYEFNGHSGLPYQLGLSMGCCIYDAGANKSVREFEAELDALMYLNKTQKKSNHN